MIGFTIAMSSVAVFAWHSVGVRVRKSLRCPAECINLLNAQVEDLLAGHSYARESHRVGLVDSAQAALGIVRTVGWLCCASPAQRASAGELARFVAMSEALVAKANEKFVDSQLLAFEEFFDSVESKPLTDAQRRACVVSEDNNLVLAGAGTGKTSAMIGRAGYLVASASARPDELLMLAYAKKAASEMQERQDSSLGRWLSDGSPTIKTFHALGLEIIGAVDGRRPDLSPMAEDQHLFAKFIDEQVSECCDDPGYQAMLIKYCGSERYPYRNPFDFSSMSEYYEYVRGNELRTLKGEVVKSFEECTIANFLSANSVLYEYERSYEVDTSGPDYRQYKPDFHLPDYGVYIEHFALDKRGLPPSHFDEAKYLDGIRWKRELHQKHGTKLVETYSYLKREGLLESHLAKSLGLAGVKLVRRPDSELLDELRKSGEVSEFAVLLSDFLMRFKESDHDLDDLRRHAASHIDSSRLGLLLALFHPILDAYETELSESGQIDFADMIRKAAAYVESGAFHSPYAHILVDEFQDISKARARLASALVRQRAGTVFFAVGDDWQSIYRFTGSDIAYTRDFSRHFGATATTPLDTTFRFNDKIGAVASKFVLKNPAQIPKSIRSISSADRPAVSLIRAVKAEDGLSVVLKAIAHRTSYGSSAKPTVLVLGRYNFTVDEWRTPSAERRLKSLYPSLQIDFMTVHSAKGKEADYVVILGLGRGKHGFPSEKSTDAVLEFLLPEQEAFPLAEERRLFYVALTRARGRVYLVYNPVEASAFVLELLDPNEAYAVCTDEFDDHLTCAEVPHVPCPICRTGALVPKPGPHGAFVGCNNFPYCTYKERPCPQCGGLMKLQGQSRVCTSPACDASVPICPKCGGSMVERSGPYGRFWGCSNYRGNGDFDCTCTINIT